MPRKQTPTKPSRTSLTEKFAKSIEDNVSHIRMNIMATVPGMLDTDELFRRMIIGYLIEHYRYEVIPEIASHFDAWRAARVRRKKQQTARKPRKKAA